MRKLKLAMAISMIIAIISVVIAGLVYFVKGDRQAKVIVTTFPIYDICREIMGSEDDLLLLMDNGVDMHSFTPTASDIASVSKAELLIYNGGESENWVPGIVKASENVNLKTLSLMNIDGITLLEEGMENILEGEEDNHEHDHEHSYDEHIWLSIKNVIKMTESIRDSLITVYPEMQELFKINAQKYMDKLQLLESEYQSNLGEKDFTLIIADRMPFRYLMNDYNINFYAVFSGCSTETQATAETITKLLEKIDECNAKYIVVLESSDRKIADSCQERKNELEILTLNSCQSVTSSIIKNISYLQIMTENLEILKKVMN